MRAAIRTATGSCTLGSIVATPHGLCHFILRADGKERDKRLASRRAVGMMDIEAAAKATAYGAGDGGIPLSKTHLAVRSL